MSYLYGLLPWIDLAFKGCELGSIESYAAGSTTPQVTYADSGGAVSNPTTMNLDANGRPSSPVFLGTSAYKFLVYDSAATLQYTLDGVTNVGTQATAQSGTAATAGSKSQSSGYTVQSTDRLVTMSTSGANDPATINLPAASTFAADLRIKNIGPIQLKLVPNGTDTIENSANNFFLIPASGATPQGTFPTVHLASDGVSNWWVLSDAGISIGAN